MSSINPQEDQQQPFKDEENTENQEAIPIGQPVAFFAEIETVSLLMKYEKIFESISEMAFTGADYLEKEFGVPYPFNYIVVVLSSILSLYLSSIIRPLICPKSKQKQHVFNTIDSVDMSRIMKTLEKMDSKINDNKNVVKSSDFIIHVSVNHS